MNTWLVLIRKDWRRHWPLFLLCWLCCAGILLTARYSEPGPRQVATYSMATTVTAWACFITAARLLLTDPLSGSTQFLATRPVSRTLSLSVKFLMATLGLAIPLVAVRLLFLVTRHVWLDHHLVSFTLCDGAGTVFLVGLILLLPDLFTRNIGTMFLSLAVALTLLTAASMLNFSMIGRLLGSLMPWAYAQEQQSAATLHLLDAACVLSVYFVWAERRKVSSVILISVFAILVRMAVPHLLPANLLLLEENSPRAGEQVKAPPIAALTFDRKPSQGFGARNPKANSSTLSLSLSPDIVPPPWIFQTIRWSAHFTLPNGKSFDSKSEQRREPPIESTVGYGLRRQFAPPGVALKPDAFSAGSRNMYFPVSLAGLSATPEPATMEGTVTLLLARPRIIASIPLRAGASVYIGKVRHSITRVQINPQSVSIRLLSEAATTSSWSDLQDGLGFVIVNRKAGQVMPDWMGGSNAQQSNGYICDQMDFVFRDFAGRTGSLGDWLADAEFCFVVTDTSTSPPILFRAEGVMLTSAVPPRPPRHPASHPGPPPSSATVRTTGTGAPALSGTAR